MQNPSVNSIPQQDPVIIIRECPSARRLRPGFDLSSMFGNITSVVGARFQKARTLLLNFSANMSVQSGIERKLVEGLKVLRPSHLEVINESYMHNVPKGSETHFKVIVVADAFQSMSLIQRHRTINNLLKTELAGPVHALSIQAKTEEQWEASGHKVTKSPPCLGGGGGQK